MPTRIIVARHGNTFKPGEVIRRVGARTDLPLVEREKSEAIGEYLNNQGYKLSKIFSGPLKRHIQTAHIILEKYKDDAELHIFDDLNEIDYGVDENKPESEVVLRLGDEALFMWNNKAIPPEGWVVDTEKIIKFWQLFAQKIEDNYSNRTVLVVSSNGIIKFIPHLTKSFNDFITNNKLKVATGNLCIFEKNMSDDCWECIEWNLAPQSKS